MLTLKQIEAEAKKRNVRLSDDDVDYYQQWALMEMPDPKEREKEIQEYIKEELAAHKQNQEWNRKNYEEMRKRYPSDVYYKKPFVASLTPTEKQLRQYYEENVEDDGYFDEGASIGFREDQSTFSCAVPEFGEFVTVHTLNKHWDLLLQWYVRTSDNVFFKCSVPDQKQYKELNAALQKIGFEKRAACKSNHGKYKVFVWEYVK